MRVGFILYPEVTALDAVGPFEVLARAPDTEVLLVAARTGPVRAQYGLELGAGTDWDSCPQLDLVCVPGGPGQIAAGDDAALLGFLRRQAASAKWITAVCTGSLILGAAGLLRGYRATTHWRYMDCLAGWGAHPVRKRVVADRNRITAAGVSAGIDMGLFLAAMIAGEQAAQVIQLQMEYDPRPPFQCGTPEQADPEVLELVLEKTQALHDQRRRSSC